MTSMQIHAADCRWLLTAQPQIRRSWHCLKGSWNTENKQKAQKKKFKNVGRMGETGDLHNVVEPGRRCAHWGE